MAQNDTIESDPTSGFDPLSAAGGRWSEI